MSTPNPSFVARLIRAVAVLALPAAGQMDYLRSVGLPEGVDELALELHDGALLVPQFLAQGWLPQAAAEAIADLDRYLGAMSGSDRASEWTTLALQDAKQWENVRQLARQVLNVI
jgi:hypothetical protein